MSLNESIIKIRVQLQKKNLKKSGKNKYAGFEYFELGDFLPTLNELMLAEGVNDMFTIEDGSACLCLMKGDECNMYKIPFTQFPVPPNKSGQPSMQDIQYLGALNTYYKRYLYLNAFGITDGEIIDVMDQSDTPKAKPVDKVITAEEAQHLSELIQKAPGESSYEEKVSAMMKKVGADSIQTLKNSQYQFLINLLAKSGVR